MFRFSCIVRMLHAAHFLLLWEDVVVKAMTFSWVLFGGERTTHVAWLLLTVDTFVHNICFHVARSSHEKNLIRDYYTWDRGMYYIKLVCYTRDYIHGISFLYKTGMLSELYAVVQKKAECPIPRCLGGVLRGTACVEETRGNSAAYGVVFSWIHKIHVWYNDVINQLTGQLLVLTSIDPSIKQPGDFMGAHPAHPSQDELRKAIDSMNDVGEPQMGQQTTVGLGLSRNLGGGFKHLVFSSLPGQMIQFDYITFFRWVETACFNSYPSSEFTVAH